MNKNEYPRKLFVHFDHGVYEHVNAGRWTVNQLKVILALIRDWYDYYPENLNGCAVPRRTLAKRANLAERTVRSVLAELIDDGVVVVVKPGEGRRSAVLMLEPDPERWGKHAPSAPPLKDWKPVNKDDHRFACGSGHAVTAEDHCGSSHAMPAGVVTPISCGSSHANSSSEVRTYEEDALDSGSSSEPPLSALSGHEVVVLLEQAREREAQRVKQLSRDYVDGIRRREALAIVRRSLGEDEDEEATG